MPLCERSRWVTLVLRYKNRHSAGVEAWPMPLYDRSSVCHASIPCMHTIKAVHTPVPHTRNHSTAEVQYLNSIVDAQRTQHDGCSLAAKATPRYIQLADTPAMEHTTPVAVGVLHDV